MKLINEYFIDDTTPIKPYQYMGTVYPIHVSSPIHYYFNPTVGRVLLSQGTSQLSIISTYEEVVYALHDYCTEVAKSILKQVTSGNTIEFPHYASSKNVMENIMHSLTLHQIEVDEREELLYCNIGVITECDVSVWLSKNLEKDFKNFGSGVFVPVIESEGIHKNTLYYCLRFPNTAKLKIGLDRLGIFKDYIEEMSQ